MYVLYLVEDDVALRTLLSQALQRYGFTVHVADGSAFHNLVREITTLQPHLILLDINLPAYDGFFWARRIRTLTKAPILFISARSEPLDLVRGLEQGGDDYLVKPFHFEVLIAKVQALLRRAYGELAGTDMALPTYAGLCADLTRSELRYGEQRVTVTPTELRLIVALIEARGKPVTRETLQTAGWQSDAFLDDNTLTVTMARLRRKLAALGLASAIETIRGVGYRLALDDGVFDSSQDHREGEADAS
jgi:DNA-binding response OmpR family regulator